MEECGALVFTLGGGGARGYLKGLAVATQVKWRENTTFLKAKCREMTEKSHEWQIRQTPLQEDLEGRITTLSGAVGQWRHVHMMLCTTQPACSLSRLQVGECSSGSEQ